MKSKERLAPYHTPHLLGADEPRPGLPRWAGWLLSALCLALVAAMATSAAEACDLWWQLKTGELIWNSRSVPHQDVFSHTAAGHPWYVQEWLAELLFFGLYRFVSPDALVAYKIGMAALVFGLVLLRCRLRGASPMLAVAVTVLAAYAARLFFDMRPQMFSYLLFCVSLLLLEARARGAWGKAVWLMPAVTLLWVNVHGGFMLVFALLGVELAAEGWRCVTGRREWRRLGELAVVTGLCGAVGLLNPNGFDAYRYAFLLLHHTTMINDIGEWWSPNFHSANTKPFAWLLLALTAALSVGRRAQARDLLLMAGLTHSALFSSRHIPLFAVACAPFIAEQVREMARIVQGWLGRRGWELASWQTAGAIALGVLLLARIGAHAREFPKGGGFEHAAQVKLFPERACDFLMAQPQGGRLLNAYDWGGYCIWRLWPKYRVFIDGRAEVYFDSSYGDYGVLEVAGPGWEAVLRRWHVDTILMPRGTLLSVGLTERPEWQLVYQDDQAEIYRRAPGPDAPRPAADARYAAPAPGEDRSP